MPGLADDSNANNKILEVEATVEAMAKKGLRTLLYGMKEIEWDGTRDPIELHVGEIESDLTLLAATGVEDLLQERVKECIVDFREAGISVWMLTGDKGLTALEIGVSCGLIPVEREEIRHNENPDFSTTTMVTEQALFQTEKPFVAVFEDTDTDATMLFEKIKKYNAMLDAQKNYSVLISGMVIAVALDNEFTHAQLGQLLKNASSVIVYRSSPA